MAAKEKPLGQIAFESHQRHFPITGIPIGKLHAWDELPPEMQEKWEDLATDVGREVSRMLMTSIGKR